MVVLNAGNPGTLTGPGNNTYLIDGEEPALIDAGVGLPAHRDAIEAALGGRPLAHVLLTHGHPDHASGVPGLRQRWPGLITHAWATREEPGWRPIADGEAIAAGDRTLTAVYTPGHAADHVCFWDGESRELFCGDMMTRDTTIMVPPASRGGSLREYLDSLRRLATLDPVRAWPGHGPVIEAPVARINEYLSHRADRERQVRACLEVGVTDPDAIVARVYADVSRDLWPAARLTVEALLEMLGHRDV